MNHGEPLSWLRRNLGLSLRDVAALVGRSAMWLHKLEKGEIPRAPMEVFHLVRSAIQARVEYTRQEKQLLAQFRLMVTRQTGEQPRRVLLARLGIAGTAFKTAIADIRTALDSIIVPKGRYLPRK